MNTKRAGWSLFFLAAILTSASAQDRSKKAYELIYEDIQVLKKQLFALEEKIGLAAEAIETLKSQVRDLQALVRLLQADQSGVQEGIKNLPTQYQYVLDKLDQMNQVLTRTAEDVLTLKGAPVQPAAGGTEPAPPEKKPGEEKKAMPPQPTPESPPPQTSSLSPQEV